jgi:hypothetical protein
MNDTNIVDKSTNKIRHKFKYINRSACKKFALEFAKTNRPFWKCHRVSEDFLISCEIALKIHIQSKIKSHPTKGKTLMA